MLGNFWSIPNSSSWAFVSKDTLRGLGISSGHWDQKASNGLLKGWGLIDHGIPCNFFGLLCASEFIGIVD
jgi:hypothetical protein